jgi:hypothetical protein
MYNWNQSLDESTAYATIAQVVADIAFGPLLNFDEIKLLHLTRESF